MAIKSTRAIDFEKNDLTALFACHVTYYQPYTFFKDLYICPLLCPHLGVKVIVNLVIANRQEAMDK